MRGLRRRDVFGDSIAQPEQVDPREQALAGSEQDRRDGEVHLVHEARDQAASERIAEAAGCQVRNSRSQCEKNTP